MLDSTVRKEKFAMLGGYVEVTEVVLRTTDRSLALDLLHKFRCETVFEPVFSFAGSELRSSYLVKSFEVSYHFLATVTLVEMV